MPNLEDDRLVLELACLTEVRSNGEHAAMKRVAKRVTQQWNRRTVTNKPERYDNPVDLVALVESTREPEWTERPESSPPAPQLDLRTT